MNWLSASTTVLLLLSAAAASTSQHVSFQAVQFTTTADIEQIKGLDPTKATLDSSSAASLLIDHFLGDISKDGSKYCIVHLLRWSDTSTVAKPVIQAQHFYLYRSGSGGWSEKRDWSQEDFTANQRIYGAKHVSFLFVHFNAASMNANYLPDYDFTITRKTPANVAHVYALLSAFTGGATATAGTGKQARVTKAVAEVVWGGGSLSLQYMPSDVLIKSTFRTGSDVLDANLSQTDQKLADDITFDDEGPYYWDVGFVVPARKISDIKLDATSGVATPAQVSGTNVFAVLDGYIKPIDVKGSGFNFIPHPLGGVAFAKQPLHKILVGGAWGPQAAELYMGAVFVKQPELSSNDSCSKPSGSSLTNKSHYCAQFTIGLNLSVSAIASKLGAPK